MKCIQVVVFAKCIWVVVFAKWIWVGWTKVILQVRNEFICFYLGWNEGLVARISIVLYWLQFQSKSIQAFVKFSVYFIFTTLQLLTATLEKSKVWRYFLNLASSAWKMHLYHDERSRSTDSDLKAGLPPNETKRTGH